jgi:hypothetical protein
MGQATGQILSLAVGVASSPVAIIGASLQCFRSIRPVG